MAINRYSLADYKMVITFPSNFNNTRLGTTTGVSTLGGQISIGGPGDNQDGSFVGNISVRRNKELWTTEGDATGSWVHNKNLDRTGEVDVDITQISDQIITLCYLCDAYDSVADEINEGLKIEIINAMSNDTIASATDCYMKKIPDHKFGNTADKLTFSFTCGRVIFY